MDLSDIRFGVTDGGGEAILLVGFAGGAGGTS